MKCVFISFFRFTWIDKDEFSGTRLGLSGLAYPAVAVSDLRRLNYHWAFGAVTTDTIPNLATWIARVEKGEVSPTLVSQNLSEAHSLGDAVKVVVLANYAEVMQIEKDIVILFHSPYCGRSRQFYGPFKQLAESLAGIESLLFAMGDGWANDFPRELGIVGMPDLKLFPKDTKTRPLR
jgi:hypothetical protein